LIVSQKTRFYRAFRVIGKPFFVFKKIKGIAKNRASGAKNGAENKSSVEFGYSAEVSHGGRHNTY
jgi:hypothetical protein